MDWVEDRDSPDILLFIEVAIECKRTASLFGSGNPISFGIVAARLVTSISDLLPG